MARSARALIWTGTLGVIAAVALLDWAYVEGQPASWGDRTPVWLYAVGIPGLLAIAVVITRRSVPRPLLALSAVVAVAVIGYAWTALSAKPPEIAGMPESGYVTFAAIVLLAGIMMTWRAQDPDARSLATSDHPPDEVSAERTDRLSRIAPA
jgi:peptidoglycan/LPS O-acetylase OafA/YrhL